MEHLILYAMSQIGMPYVWAGGSPLVGFDCSGYATWLLKSAGMAPASRTNAQGIYDHLVKSSTPGPFQAGSFAFYGASITKIDHVMFMIDSYRVIGPTGGDHTCLTPKDALAKDAYVKIRLLKYRPDFLQTLKPQYVTIGMT